MDIKIFLFGMIEVMSNKQLLASFPTKKSRAIFVFLALSRGKHFQREVLASEFWQKLSPTNARKALNTDIWRLSRSLKGIGVEMEQLIAVTDETLAFVPSSHCWVDVENFQQGLQKIDEINPNSVSKKQIDDIEAKLALYRGELFEQCYEDWCMDSRDSLRETKREALELLLWFYMRHQHWARAVKICQELLVLDNLLEHVYRCLLLCHYRLGNRPAAIRAYRHCCKVLKRELSIEPMPETQRVFNGILQGKCDKSIEGDVYMGCPVTEFVSV